MNPTTTLCRVVTTAHRAAVLIRQGKIRHRLADRHQRRVADFEQVRRRRGRGTDLNPSIDVARSVDCHPELDAIAGADIFKSSGRAAVNGITIASM